MLVCWLATWTTRRITSPRAAIGVVAVLPVPPRHQRPLHRSPHPHSPDHPTVIQSYRWMPPPILMMTPPSSLLIHILETDPKASVAIGQVHLLPLRLTCWMNAGVSTASDGEWSYPHYRHNMPCHPNVSPEHSRVENILECPSFASIATFESLTDRPPSEKADTTSHFSVDAEGYYTSMHFDCGLKGSKSFTYNYASVDQQAEYGHQTNTLGRHSLSLRKPKVKPSPPKRSSSLKKISSHVGPPTDKNEPKNAVGQNKSMSSGEITQHVGLNGGSSSQLESEEPLGAWGVESSTEIPEVALFGSTETHSFKDEELSSQNMQISGFLMTWNPMILTDHCQIPAQLRVTLSSNALSHRRALNPRLPSQDLGPPLLHYHRWKASLDCLHLKSW